MLNKGFPSRHNSDHIGGTRICIACRKWKTFDKFCETASGYNQRRHLKCKSCSSKCRMDQHVKRELANRDLDNEQNR